MEQLHEPDIAFGQTAGQQTVCGIAAGTADVRAVRIEDMLRLFGGIEQIGDTGLHAKRHFVLSNSSLDLRIADVVEVLLIQCRESVESPATSCLVDAGRVRQEQHRIALVAKLDSLMHGGKKAGTPQAIVERLIIWSAAAK
jgi:hypothetical protein